MKQHITLKQLNELTEEKKEKLREWWIKSEHAFNKGYWFDSEDRDEDDDPKKKMILGDPLLSIGQIIEFLIERDMGYEIGNYFNTDIIEQEQELCDYLWEVVKEVLNDTNS